MSKLFHATSIDLDAGAVIRPGNWGKGVMEFGPNHQSWRREIVLEFVRMKFFDTKPSRLAATFCCDTLEAARFYSRKNVKAGVVYEVELVQPEAPKHRGDFNAIEPLPGRSEDYEEIALKYWQYSLNTTVAGYPDLVCDEIVSTSPLRVVRKVAK